MNATKILKAHCKNTGQYYVIEAEKTGAVFFATKFYPISLKQAKEIKSEISPLALQTNDNLPKCKVCGSRKVGHGHDDNHACECEKNPKNKQCIYCGNLEYDQIGSTSISATKKTFDKKIYVSSKGYDDVGAVLNTLKVKWEHFDGKYDCNILFINCLTDDDIDEDELNDFVQKGGCVYGSCTISSLFEDAFPNYFNFHEFDSYYSGIEKANVLDSELKRVLGNEIEFMFNVAARSVPFGPKLEPLIVGSSGRFKNKNLVVRAKIGKGLAYFTTYHNDPKLTLQGKKVLEVLVLKQLANNEGLTITEMANFLGYKL